MTAGRESEPGTRCVGEPVSWLRLEGFHLGEVLGADRDRIAEHVAACSACAACLARIREDDALALPPLAVAKAIARPAAGPARRVFALFPGGAMASVGALAAAAMLVLALRGSGRSLDGGGVSGAGGRIKGDAVAFSLVRDDGERILGGSGVFRDGDRFKAVVTCPPGGSAAFDLVVRERGRDSFPLEPARNLACGNEVPLPGAFRLSGDAEETVCLVWSESGVIDRAIDRTGDRTEGPVTEDRPGLCKRLSPAVR